MNKVNMEWRPTRSAVRRKGWLAAGHWTLSGIWGGPNQNLVKKNLESLVTEWSWLWSQDTGLFQFSKGSVGPHSQLQGGLRNWSWSCFTLWPCTTGCIRFIWPCHVQSNHMLGLQSIFTVNIHITNNMQLIWCTEIWLQTLKDFPFHTNTICKNKTKNKWTCQHAVPPPPCIFLFHLRDPTLFIQLLLLFSGNMKSNIHTNGYNNDNVSLKIGWLEPYASFKIDKYQTSWLPCAASSGVERDSSETEVCMQRSISHEVWLEVWLPLIKITGRPAKSQWQASGRVTLGPTLI